MARYSYRAMNGNGRRVKGQSEAAHVDDLEARLRRMDLDLISAQPVAATALPQRRVSRRALIKFCFHLEQLTRAGVPIIEALGDLRDSLQNPRLREVVANIVESIEGGSTLSQALARHPRIFDTVFVSLVAAGETSGSLPNVLRGLVGALKWQDELAAKSKRLLLYPALVSAVLCAATGFVVIYLLPRMAIFIKAMGHRVPASTQFLLSCADAIGDYWLALLLAPAAAWVAVWAMLGRSAAVRYRVDCFKLSLPFIGTVLRKMALSRFAGIFAMMYAAGISILDAIRAGEAVVGNAAISQGLAKVGRLIAEGQSLTAAFNSTGLFPPMVVRMLRVGENTGGIDTALMSVRYFYDRDVQEAVDRLQTLVEPVLTLLLGLILGGVMLSAFAPLYDIIAGLN